MGLLPAGTIIVASPARLQASQPVSATTGADLDTAQRYVLEVTKKQLMWPILEGVDGLAVSLRPLLELPE